MNNFKKRILIVVLSILLILSITACGNNVGTTENDATKNNTKTEVSQDKKIDVPKLEKNNWAEENCNALQNLIDTYGINSPDYDKNNKPYAVFDWDNTCIVFDVEEALLVYQIVNLEFKMTPEEFLVAIKKDVPEDNFSEECNNKDGKAVNINLVAKDLFSDYKYLYDNYKGLNGDKSLDEIKETLEYKDFVAKLRYLYDSIGETFSADISYPWVTYLFTGMNKNEVQALTEKSTDFWLKEELTKKTLVSPDELPGKAGVVSIDYKSGLRLLPEQQNLIKTFRDNGIDVYICSASFVDVVKTLAGNSKYGYNLPEENVIAMELERDDKGIIMTEYRKGYDQTQTKGKTKNIERFLVSKYGEGPIFVAGDSGGDFAMLTDFEDTKLALIINRCKGGEIGEISKEATDTFGKEDAKYLLQGRDENLGVFRPSQKSIFLGSSEEKLLK